MIPDTFDERDVLKFIQANHWHLEKSAEKVTKHIKWLASLPTLGTISQKGVRFLQSGSFYIHGRDKDFRPCFVMDAQKMSALYATDPEICTN